MNILFVCTGNTCRSPMAEKILKKKASEECLDINIKSAGIAAIDGDTYSKHAETIIKTFLNEEHKAQRVSKELFEWADLILTMTNNHKKVLLEQEPWLNNKIFTLKEYTISEDIDRYKEKMDKLYEQVEQKKEEFYLQNQQKIESLEEKYNSLIKEANNILIEINKYKNLYKESIKEVIIQIEELSTKASYLLDVADPYGQDLEFYQSTAAELDELINKLLQKIANNEKKN